MYVLTLYPSYRGDHTGIYEKVSMADLKKLEGGNKESEDTESTSALKDSPTL